MQATFITYLTRGAMEREIEVEATYTFDGQTVEVTKAYDRTEARDLTDWEWQSVYDDACRDCETAWPEWLAEREEDRGEYLYGQWLDRRAA